MALSPTISTQLAGEGWPADKELPPHPVHSVELSSSEGSKITGVSIYYSGRAEITRVFKLNVKPGQNEVIINGLPNVLDEQSLRVEGRGAAIIHDVTISQLSRPAPVTSSPTLKTLLAKKDRVKKAVGRCKKSIESLEAYLKTLHVQYIEVSKLGEVMKGYDSTAEELDLRLLALEGELAEIEEDLQEERTMLSATASHYNDKLGLRATIGVFSDEEAEVELTLIYAVHGAAWNALYDIRINMETKGQPIVLAYKASIVQNTGEDWKDVPLVLETTTPTFGVSLPTLEPWTISTYKPPPFVPTMMPMACPPSSAPAPPASARTRSRRAAPPPPPPPPAMGYNHASISPTRGNISATFRVTGLMTIPSDGASHKVTISELRLSAVMTWVCVPKKDTKTHLNAKIKNNSEYTLLGGTASVYVDGSFLSRTDVPAVSPDESFAIPLGLDSTIRVTYHPQRKKRAESGFYNKTVHHVFTQNITVHNTKSISVDGVKIIDQFPISEDAQIQVKNINPTLSAPLGTNGTSEDVTRRPVIVTKGITAIWDGADDAEADVDSLGKNGKFNWLCSIPPQGKVNLTLQWEVAAPSKTDIAGMLSVCYP